MVEGKDPPDVTFSLGEDSGACEIVRTGLRASNALRSSALAKYYATVPRDEPLHVFARDISGKIIGGLTGEMALPLFWCHIGRLWVSETYQRRGLGTQLMLIAEEEARRRGCRYVRVETMDFQAPEFYAKLGYREYGRLEESLTGATELLLRKDLRS